MTALSSVPPIPSNEVSICRRPGCINDQFASAYQVFDHCYNDLTDEERVGATNDYVRKREEDGHVHLDVPVHEDGRLSTGPHLHFETRLPRRDFGKEYDGYFRLPPAPDDGTFYG